ncbi:MAG: 2Fe-2S iron-sulfur cluster binding domain-containing protein [Provencibacterium sp.]|jgi:NADP-reducing hydrogenase subunit HndD|nr:2Fe-2S iron-sulfur cluster binding domain-containing protein [Provencibacterium sp.]
MEMVNIKINGLPLSVPKGSTILEAARQAGIEIPTLCFLRDINEIGACRICVVEVKGARSLVASCVYPVNEGMEVFTNSARVQESRKTTLELILSDHEKNCLFCVRSGNCELQKLAQEYGLSDPTAWAGETNRYEIDDSATHMWRNNNKCILCRRCAAVCEKNQAVGVIGANDRGFKTHIGCAFELDLAQTPCVSCGQCITVCPVGAIGEKDDGPKVTAALRDPEKYVVVQAAPSIRATLGEEFGLPVGSNVEGKMAAALRRLGFDKVFDTDFGADLTIMEEANELVERVQNGGKLPMITSCSPGWINFCEMYYPDMLDNLSSCKSPQQMFGAVIKTWYAKKENLDPKNIVSVSVMPCTAKKYEIGREDQSAAGVPDLDITITTRELARLIRAAGIDFANLPDEEFDTPLGIASGAGHIFGATGGVMEAALRTAYETITGEKAGSLEWKEVRGTEGVKEASYKVGALTVNVAVASGLSNARKVLDAVKSGEKDYTFIEIMACPGGCVNGGGQPIQPASVRNFTDLKALRAKALYEEDAGMDLRKSHENPAIQELYRDFLEKPGSHVAHEVLHTSYKARKRYTV